MKQELFYRELEWRMLKHLRAHFPDVAVRVCRDKYAPGLNVEVISATFRDLLPEQRYHHVRRSFPEGTYPAELDNAVIVELAPDETLSELEGKTLDRRRLTNEEIEEKLRQIGFFRALGEKLGCGESGDGASKACREDFEKTQGVLREAGLSHEEELEVLEYLMERGAFCDCEVFRNLR
ncbi:MAG: hypothetical protein V2A58_09620 [Planctomycetota bacterium]